MFDSTKISICVQSPFGVSIDVDKTDAKRHSPTGRSPAVGYIRFCIEYPSKSNQSSDCLFLIIIELVYQMDLPFEAPGQIIPRSRKDFPELHQLPNPNGGSCLSLGQPDNSSGRTRLPRVDPKNQPMTTNCCSDIQTENARQNPHIQKSNHSPPNQVTCVENGVIKHGIPKETTKRDIESNQTNTYNPELGAAIEVPEMITRSTYRKFNLEIEINDQPVTMTIDSGCHISIIGKLIWQQLGQPKLEPVTEAWCGATGSHIEFAGKFTANVNYAGKSLQLPLHVMEQSNTANLLGRVWFPSLHLDWNRIFNSSDVSQCQPDSIEQRQLALKTIQSCNTAQFYVDLNVQGKTVRMMLDTGATVSVISQATWEMLGKPPLLPAPREMIDANQKVIPSIGICMVTVKYNGREGYLPLFIRTDDYKSIVGTSWFATMKFDFNSIFGNMKLIPPRNVSDSRPQNPQIGK